MPEPMKPAPLTILLAAALSSLPIQAAEIGGTWDQLEPGLMKGDLSKLPGGTQKQGNHYYCTVLKQMNWNRAKTWCEKRGGHLATITSAEESKFCQSLVTASIPSGQNYLHFGASDAEKEGDWRWVTGEKMTFTQWAKGQPNNANNKEHCLAMRAGENPRGAWHDHLAADATIKGFIIEWDSTSNAKNPGKIKSPLADVASAFPDSLRSMHTIMQQKILAQKDNLAPLHPLIKSYGQKIVAAEKKATRARDTRQALALRKVRDNLLALLAVQTDTPDTPDKPVASTKLVLLDKGHAHEKATVSRDHWKKRNSSLVSKKKGSVITLPGLIIGSGDFSVSARLQLSYIGKAGPGIAAGMTSIGIDGENTRAWMGYGAFQFKVHKGKRIAGLVSPNTPFNWSVERKGGELITRINDKELQRQPIHSKALGAFQFYSGKATVTLEDLTITANLAPDLAPAITIAGVESPRNMPHRGVILTTGAKSRLVLTVGRQKKNLAIRAMQSRDGGESWTGPEIWLGPKDAPLPYGSLAAAASPNGKDIHAFYTVSETNHRVFYRRGKSSGRSWTKPVEITKTAKDKGWNVVFYTSGIVTRHRKNKHRIIVPYLAGGEKLDLYLLTSNDGGQLWHRSKPIIKDAHGEAHIIETPDGQLVCATGKNNSDGLRFFRSDDGGKTWDAGHESPVGNSRLTGTLCQVALESGKSALLYAGVGHIGKDHIPNHLNLYISTDGGKAWKILRRVETGIAYFPCLRATGPGEAALYSHVYAGWGNHGRYHYHVIRLSELGVQ